MSSPAPSDGLLSSSDAWTDEAAEVEAASKRQRERLEKRHWSMLKICAFVVLMACLLQVRPDHDRVQFRWGPDIPLPESCGSKVFLGLDCPGCGLTRGFISLTRGDFWLAWKFNRVSWLLVVALLIQFPYRLWSLRQIQRGRIPDTTWPVWFGRSLIVALIGNWLLKVMGI